MISMTDQERLRELDRLEAYESYQEEHYEFHLYSLNRKTGECCGAYLGEVFKAESLDELSKLLEEAYRLDRQ
jgi:hypothetical protein